MLFSECTCDGILITETARTRQSNELHIISSLEESRVAEGHDANHKTCYLTNKNITRYYYVKCIRTAYKHSDDRHQP